jgi:hypothetical protein
MTTTTTLTCARIFAQADEAGRAAAEAIQPVPMIVQDARTGYVYPPVLDGVCGFAWVIVPGNTSFGRYLKAEKGCTKGYPKGISYWISGYQQSLTRKEAYAYAFAAILREHGIKGYAHSRID